MTSRSDDVSSSAPDALDHGRDDAVPLLGLTSTEADVHDPTGENLVSVEGSNPEHRRFPLLGTTDASGFVQRRPVSGWFNSIF
jgi:hypothetical protein